MPATILPAGVGRGGPRDHLSPMNFSALADAGDECNALLGNMFPSVPPVQQPPPPLTPTHGYSPSAQWHRQRRLRIQELAKGLIHPSMLEYIQQEFKITNQDVAALIASGSHRSGPPGGGTPSRGPPRGRDTPSSRGPPSGRGPPGGGGGGGGGGGDPPPPSPQPPSQPPPSPSPSPPGSSKGSRRRRGRRGGRRMNQNELHRQMDLLAEFARQCTEGRYIQKVTPTNTVTTVCEDDGPPMSVRTSSRISNP